MAIYAIVAMDPKGVIGFEGKMPWGRLPRDMKYFYDMTLNNMVVMGRKTFESIYKKYPRGLPDRENVVMSRKIEGRVGIWVCRDIKSFLNDAVEIAEKNHQNVFIIGGGEIYKQFLPYVSKVFLTIVHYEFEGDAFFPKLEESEWREASRNFFDADENNRYDLTFVTYERKEKKVVDTTHAKTGAYGADLLQIKELKVCPFCPGQMHWHKKPILKETVRWFITESTHPYENSTHHVLVICKEHLEHFNPLTCDDWWQVMSLFNWYCDEHGIIGGGIAMRFGETTYTGATVCHLHFHLIVPEIDPESGKAKPVYFPIG